MFHLSGIVFVAFVYVTDTSLVVTPNVAILGKVPLEDSVEFRKEAEEIIIVHMRF